MRVDKNKAPAGGRRGDRQVSWTLGRLARLKRAWAGSQLRAVLS